MHLIDGERSNIFIHEILHNQKKIVSKQFFYYILVFMAMFINEMYMFTLLDVTVFFWHNNNVKVKACKEHRHHQYQIFILLLQFSNK